MLEQYLSPQPPEDVMDIDRLHPFQLGRIVKFSGENMPDLRKVDIAIIGVCEGRDSVHNPGSEYAPMEIRRQLYRLYKGNYAVNIHDLGNIQGFDSAEESREVLRLVLRHLLEQRVVTIVLGGGQDLSLAQYQAYAGIQDKLQMVMLDDKIDFMDEGAINSENYLRPIFLDEPNHLFNYCHLAYQTYLNDVWKTETLESMQFESYRLGVMQGQSDLAEALLRDADMLSVDMSVVRMSDAPGNHAAGPNGLFGNELCQILRYAGYSERLSSVGIYELNPECDPRHQSAALAAQSLWYFIDGFYNRKNDFPHEQNPDSMKYVVAIEGFDEEIIFWKSMITNRWWMDMPFGEKDRFGNRHLVPCTYEDYLQACNNELPARWMRVYRKLK